MKKILTLVITLFVILPIINVNALSCRGETEETAIDLSISNFKCIDIKGDNLTFTNNSSDVSKYFKVGEISEGEATIEIVDKNLTFAKELKYGLIIITDSSDTNNSTRIFMKNSAYVEPTTTTTTTKDPSIKTITVTLDPNDGSEIKTETCDINSVNTTCYINLPKLEKDTFSGWGTAKTCKTGNEGSIKVDKDMTYYACYTDNESETITDLLLKTLIIKDKNTDEQIDFGTFSIKNKEYNFKVLNNVENLLIEATAEENIEIEITGNENLAVGENKVTIKLRKGNDLGEYILNVTRLEVGETINNTRYLKSLVIGGYENQLNFNKEQFDYTLTIPNNINKLQITALPLDDDDRVEELNNENLDNGSKIVIKVSNDESSTEYTIDIIKEKNSNNLLLIGIGLIVLLIIILIILIIIKSKKNKRTQPKKNNKEKIEVLNI